MFLNQRQFARCPHETVQSEAVLVVGGRKVPCQLIEISLGGFAVVVAEPLSAALADPLASLQFDGLSYIVRVSRQETRRDGVLVGLEQIEEVVPVSTTLAPTTLGRWMTRVTWCVAIGLVMAAAYSIAGPHLEAALSLR